jgi:hypothetical protein
MKRWFHFAPGMFFIIIICVLLIPSGCTAKKSEGFAIYLTKENISPSQLAVSSQIDIADQPVISLKDITTYNSQTHELKLNSDAYDRIASLQVPVRGTSFVICVDRKIIYAGAFWTPISSVSFDGVTIWKPYNTQGPNIVTLELGYPSVAFYAGQDPRNSPEILESLQHAGKLISKLTLDSVAKLPRSMKGYELYSWLENSQWHFTLITGTNRNKTLEEITSELDFISEAGWVKVSVAGADALKAALNKLPPGESVFWLGTFRDSSVPTDVKINLPPNQISDDIQESALKHDLDFQIAAP